MTTTTREEHLAALVDRCTAGELAAITERLDGADLAIVERVVAERAGAGWRATPATMAHHLTGGKFQLFPYTTFLGQKFTDLARGRSKRQIWNLPARYGKTDVGSKWGPTWAFDDSGGAAKIILASYGDTLADENAAFVRDTLLAHRDVLGTELKPDRRRMDRFVTTNGGGLIAAGIGSGLTGFGGNGAVIDDPFKDWQAAHSEATRNAVWNWYRAVLHLRLEDENAWILLVMTRWHEDDLTGKLLDAGEQDGESWEVVRLPAICDDPDNDPLHRPLGAPLEPRRFSLEAVLKRAAVLGSYLASGLEQQRPSPEEGTDVMRDWWKWFDTPPPRFDDAITSWDVKLKDKESGDFVVGIAGGRVGADFYITDMLRGRWDFPTTKAAMVLLAVRHPECTRHVIENAGNGPEAIKELRKPDRGYQLSEKIIGDLGITVAEIPKVERMFRRGMTALIAENVREDKRVRMRAQTGKIEGGHVHVPNYAGIGESIVNEAATFPNGAHDDQVDATSQLLKRLSSGRARTAKPRGQVRTPAPSVRSTSQRGGTAARRRPTPRPTKRIVPPPRKSR